MTAAKNYGNGYLVALDVYEGNITENTHYSTGGDRTDYSWASEVSKGDFMVMHTADLTVAAAAAGTQDLLGIAANDPELQGDGMVPSSWLGASNSSTTDYRVVTVEIFGLFIRVITLGAGATSTVRGGYVKPHGSVVNVWDKDTTANKTFCLEVIAAGGTGAVVFGWQGAF